MLLFTISGPALLKGLGIDYDAVKRRKPDIVYLNLTAFNGPRPGPWMNRPGFDPLLQGSTGIQMRYAGEGNKPILHGWASCIDYITGYSATYGAVLALLKRRRSGVPDGGDFVTTSLAQGGQLVQAPFMFACEAECSGDEPSGAGCCWRTRASPHVSRARWLGFPGRVGA